MTLEAATAKRASDMWCKRGVPIDEIEVLRPSSELLERRGNGRYPVGYTQLGSAPSRLFTERF